MYRYCIYGHCYSLCKQIKLLMSKILSIIGKKKELLERKMGRKKSKIDWSLPTSRMCICCAKNPTIGNEAYIATQILKQGFHR